MMLQECREPSIRGTRPLRGGEPISLDDARSASGTHRRDDAHRLEAIIQAEVERRLAHLKSELLSTISHELRTPLSLIYGYAELLVSRAEQLGTAEIAEMSGEIHTSSQTLARMVDDLLDFSQLDRGHVPLHRRDLVLGDVLESVVQTFQAQSGGERITAACAPGLAVFADPERLRQVLSHILSNAVTYAEDGPIVVRAFRAGDGIRVEVTDCGPGLSEEEASRVWESLYRGARATRLPNRGSGLGLSVVKQLVEQHGGTVGVCSVQGQGATFWLTLPAVCPGVTAMPARRDARSGRSYPVLWDGAEPALHMSEKRDHHADACGLLAAN